MNWHAVYVKNRHEKKFASRLQILGIEAYVPIIRVQHRWNDGQNKTIEVPIFPGYVFVKADSEQQKKVARVPSFFFFVEDVNGPVLVSDQQLETIRISTAHYQVAPHANLRAGRIANVIRGPLAGRKGFLGTMNDQVCVVFTIESIGAAIAVAVESSEIELQ